MKYVYNQIIICIGLPYSSLTSLRITLNSKGVITEIGKCPSDKILIDVVYICSWVINFFYKVMHLSCTVLT